MGKSGHQYGQNFYTNIGSFLAKLPKQLIYLIFVKILKLKHLFAIICFNLKINLILDQPLLVQYLIRKKSRPENAAN